LFHYLISDNVYVDIYIIIEMIKHPTTSSWAFYTKQQAKATAKPLTSEGYNANYLKPQYTEHETPPSTKEMPLRYVYDTFSPPIAKNTHECLNKNAVYNASYLKAEPGIYYQDPILTPWSQAGALKELGTRIPDTQPEAESEETLEDKLTFLIEADPPQVNQWSANLATVQQITLYASRYPMTEVMKSALVAIGDSVRARFDAAQSGRSPFGATGLPANPNAISGPIIAAIQGLNNPTAIQIAAAVQGAIGNNPTAAAISAPIVAAIQALNNPSAAQIAAAVRRIIAQTPVAPGGPPPIPLNPVLSRPGGPGGPGGPQPLPPLPPLPPGPPGPQGRPLQPQIGRVVDAIMRAKIIADSTNQQGEYRIRAVLWNTIRDRLSNMPGQSSSLPSNDISITITGVLRGRSGSEANRLVNAFMQGIANKEITFQMNKNQLDNYLQNRNF
jgi:hypothetical protein